MNTLQIYLKNGQIITLTGNSTAKSIQESMTLREGSTISFGNGSFILCSEIAAVMQND